MPRYSFGPFELDSEARLLYREGEPIPLAGKTLDTLLVLIENRGRLVDKDELLSRVWVGTVVEEANLTQTVFTVRKVLGDSPKDHRYIATVAGRGYQFVAPVVERTTGTQVVSGNGQESPTQVPRSWQKNRVFQFGAAGIVMAPLDARIAARSVWRAGSIAAVAGILAIAAGLAIWIRLPENGKQNANATLHVIPATTYPGSETDPTLSPDGSQLAFAWDGENHNNFDIYVKVVGENRALRLTSDPRPEFSPVWSSDGRRIAFCRDGLLGSEVVVIPALGGPERIVANLPEQADREHPGRPKEWSDGSEQLAWFPDGRFLAVVARQPEGLNAIFLLTIDDGVMQQLTSPPGQSWGDGSPSISPDGRRLVFTRSRTKWPDPAYLYLLPLSAGKAAAGEPQLVTPRQIDYGGLSWTSDGRRLVFAAERGLWTVAFHKAPELLSVPGYNPSYPAIATKGDRLAFVDSSEDLDIWRVDGPAVKNRSAGGNSTPTRLIASTRDDTNPQYSPDGRRIAFTSARAGTDDIWASDSDGSNPVQVTDLKAETGTPRWSPDGRYLAFDSMKSGSEDIYVVPVQGGPIRRMTSESSQEYMASWSQDGRWIYFDSDRGGIHDVWKTAATGGSAVAVTTKGGTDAFESRDGKFVYYAKWGQQGIWRRLVAGGPETLVMQSGSPYYWGLFDNGICLLDPATAAGPTISCLDFGSHRMTKVCTLPKGTRINKCGPSFSVSHDGRWILYAGVQRQESDIMVVENFR